MLHSSRAIYKSPGSYVAKLLAIAVSMVNDLPIGMDMDHELSSSKVLAVATAALGAVTLTLIAS